MEIKLHQRNLITDVNKQTTGQGNDNVHLV